MKFCIQCGSTEVTFSTPTGDNRDRHHCRDCEHIHYENPKIVAGTLPYHQDKVLLCKRAIEPRHGYWTLPAGFMENGETTQQGAIRETWEEAEANINIQGLYTLFDLPDISQVHFYYLGEVPEGKHGVGPESLECAWFSEAEIPWEELAFTTVVHTLKHFFKDRSSGQFDLKMETLQRKNRP